MIKRFNRYEIKYSVPVASLRYLKPDLERFLGRDKHGNSSGFYSIASLYFDTPDLACYTNKLDGLLFRRKLRIRVYPDPKTTSRSSRSNSASTARCRSAAWP